MKTNALITTINTCIDRLNTVKQVLKDESKELEKNDLIFTAVRYFVNKLYEYVIHYSQPFIKKQ